MAYETKRLGEGVGPLCWSDTPTTLVAKYPAAQPIPVRHARNPRTGQAIVLNGGYRVTGLLGTDDVWRVIFDGDHVASLEWWGEADGENWRAVEHAAESMIRALADRYGFGPIEDPHRVSTWTVDDVRVDFGVEGELYVLHIAPRAAFELAASA